MNQNNQAMAMLQCDVQGMSISSTGLQSQQLLGQVSNLQYQPTLWNYWQYDYYPQVIRESYPVYIQERAMDKGKHAFELLKVLMDKGLLKVEKVKDFIEAMDAILKTL